MRCSILIAALPLLAACQQQTGEAKLVPLTQAQAEKIIEATDQSYTSGDTNRIMANYANGAVMFDQGLLAPVAGCKLIRELSSNSARLVLKGSEARRN